MSKSKSRLEKIADMEEEIIRIRNRQKLERQKYNKEERAVRTRRLCSRHGLLESMLPEIVDITDEQYKSFLERAVANNYGRNILNKIITQTAATAPPPSAESAAQGKTAPTDKPIKTAQGNAEDEG